MSLTGLFLCTFLVVHLIGNLQLFKHDDGVAFNTYSHFMGTNPVIRTIEWGLVLGFGFHIYEALMLTLRNKKALSRLCPVGGQAKLGVDLAQHGYFGLYYPRVSNCALV